MKRFVLDFLRRGFFSCGIGPLVLAVIYLILQHHNAIEKLTVNQVCTGIFSLAALSFMAGGINAIYQIERLPLMAAVSVHGAVLYLSYLATYLLNDWLERGIVPLLVFTGIFLVGYVTIWIVIYSVVKRNTGKLNESLKKKQSREEP
jgi:branched-subunit amino acid ABC-type transport system permease component